MYKDIFLYATLSAWLQENPDGSVKGTVMSKNGSIIEILDENGLTQLINLDKLYAVVY